MLPLTPYSGEFLLKVPKRSLCGHFVIGMYLAWLPAAPKCGRDQKNKIGQGFNSAKAGALVPQ